VQHEVKTFKPQTQPADATVVSAPPGGWDDAAPHGQGNAGAVATTIKLGKR
jgi:hypothetical protein